MGMTVQELIERLQECDPDAEVRIMSQESWPFENAVSGVAVREEFDVNYCECDHRFTEPHDEGCARGQRHARPPSRMTCSSSRAHRSATATLGAMDTPESPDDSKR